MVAKRPAGTFDRRPRKAQQAAAAGYRRGCEEQIGAHTDRRLCHTRHDRLGVALHGHSDDQCNPQHVKPSESRREVAISADDPFATCSAEATAALIRLVADIISPLASLNAANACDWASTVPLTLSTTPAMSATSSPTAPAASATSRMNLSL